MNGPLGLTPPASLLAPDGQCRLTLSSSRLLLEPVDGNLLWIADKPVQIPGSGVTLDVSGAANSTTYYIYAWFDGMVRLERSATAYVADARTGHRVKGTDRGKRLVGMARTTASGAWVDGDKQRFVRSYFNDPGYALNNVFTANRSVTSTGYTEINTEIRIEFLTWTGEVVPLTACGAQLNTNGGSTVQTVIAIDGVVQDCLSFATAPTGATAQSMALSLNATGLSEGYHYATLMGAVSASTGTWLGGNSNGSRSTLKGHLRR